MSNCLRLAVLLCIARIGTAWAAPPLEAYGALPGIENVALSPSGQQYALFGMIAGSRQLAVLSFDGQLLFAMSVGTAKVRDIEWAGESHVLLTVSATMKEPLAFLQDYEMENVLNIDLGKRSVRPVFAGKVHIANVVLDQYGVRQVDGHWCGYFGGITYQRSAGGDYGLVNAYADLYRVDLQTGETFREAEGSDLRRSWLIAADGSLLAHSEYEEHSGMWRLYAGGARGRMLMQRAAPLHNVFLIGPGRQAGTLLVGDNSGTQDVAEEVSIADGKVEPLFGDFSTEEYLFDPDTNQLIGAKILEEPKAQFFDLKLLARFKGARKAFPGFNVAVVSYSRGLQRLIVKTDGGNDSGTYWTVDIASGTAKPMGRTYSAILEADVGETRAIHYAAADGLAIEAILTLPPGKQAAGLPLVVLPHGGPIGVSDTIGFDWWAQAYASRGYAVLQPNFRGSSGYGRAFRQAGYSEWGRKMQTDLSDGVAALAREGLIDEKRVCIVGASYGGYAALAGVTLQQGIYRCAVSVAGPADLQTFFYWHKDRHGYDSESTRYWRAVVGADKEGDKVMAALSPALAAERADAPILLIHGKDDTVVPIEQSESMQAALKRAKKPYEILVMKGEDHWLSREETRTGMLKAAVAFVEKYNPATTH